jgi:hypothetical protein
MAATIDKVRRQIRDTKEPYTFHDEDIQDALDAAADFIYRKYNFQGSVMLYQSNDPAIMPVQTGMYYTGRGMPWIDYWLNQAYVIDINTPTGGKLQKLMASVDLMSSLLMPTPDRAPTGISEGGLSIQWGGDYQSAIQVWSDQIEKIMFSMETPLFMMYNNY